MAKLKDIKIKLTNIDYRDDDFIKKIVAKEDLPAEMLINGSDYAKENGLNPEMEITKDFETEDYENYYAENYVSYVTGWGCDGCHYELIM